MTIFASLKLKNFPFKQLIPGVAIKALSVTVSPRNARLDEGGFDNHPLQSSTNCPDSKLRAII
jgi:hypothetical protein